MKRLMVLLMVLIPGLMWGQVFKGLVNEPLTTGGMISTGTLTLTRPSNATAYVANDFVGSSTVAGSNFFWKLPTARKSGFITDLSLFADTAETGSFRFWILHSDTTNWTKIADNGVFTLIGTDSSYIGYLGYIDIDIYAEGTGSTASFGQTDGIGMAFTAPDRYLYGLLQVKSAYTPKNGGVFKLKYRLLQ